MITTKNSVRLSGETARQDGQTAGSSLRINKLGTATTTPASVKSISVKKTPFSMGYGGTSLADYIKVLASRGAR